jgi:hypothetical protein
LNRKQAHFFLTTGAIVPTIALKQAKQQRPALPTPLLPRRAVDPYHSFNAEIAPGQFANTPRTIKSANSPHNGDTLDIYGCDSSSPDRALL